MTWLGKEQGVFRERFPLEGYRQLAFIHDARPGILAASPSSMYRSCSRCGHERWHIDIAYLNLEGTYYLCSSVNDQFPVEISCPHEPGGQPHLDRRASAAHSVRFCITIFCITDDTFVSVTCVGMPGCQQDEAEVAAIHEVSFNMSALLDLISNTAVVQDESLDTVALVGLTAT